MTGRGGWGIAALALGLVLGAAEAQDRGSPTSGGSCVACHIELEEPSLSDPTVEFAGGVHDREELGCVLCHGGDASRDEADEAMDPARGFRGTPTTREIPSVCGGCHGDAAYIKRFDPNLPTDQLAQYETSVHGQRLEAGDRRVATCVSCHGVHGILAASDPRSPVYPTRVVGTCAGCHGNGELMDEYGISSDQVELYRGSIHYLALTEGNDLSAPTCNDCHGSHGATPPGVDSVSSVCGSCHPMNMDYFARSPHGAAFAELELGACEACHGNHRVLLPDDDWLGVGEESSCGECHERDDAGGEVALALHSLLEHSVSVLNEARDQVHEAERAGMLMEDSAVQLEEAHQELVRARTEVHLASIAAVETHTSAAVESAETALAAAAEAQEEIRYRRGGLLVALAFILVAIVALVLKIREIER